MSSLDHTLAIVKRNLSTGQWQPGTRIPSIDSLSHLCGTSKSTVCRALALLKKDSLIHGGSGAGIFAGPMGITAWKEPTHSQVWMRLKTRLGHDIRVGRYSSGVFLQPGKLAIEYGVSFRTMRKALIALKRDGLIEEMGRKYRPAHLSGIKHKQAVAFISGGTSLKGITTADHRTESLLESFERETHRLGMLPHCEGFESGSPSGVLKSIASLKHLQRMSGAIINMWNPWNPDVRQRWLDLIDFLLTLAIPVIIIDQDGSIVFPAKHLQNDHIRILRIPGKRAGEIVADTLLQHGHKTIAYISPYFNFEWSQSRYAGLRNFCKRYGSPGTTTELFVRHQLATQDELTLAFLELTPEKLKALFRDRLSKDDLSGFLDQLKRVQSLPLSNEFSGNPLKKTILPFSDMLADLAQKDYDRIVFDQMLSFLQHIASTNAFDLYLRPYLLESLKKSRATAWVCSDEATAITAKSAILSAGKSVPGDISVVGFENWRGAHEHQLSVYDFNMNGHVLQALMMIMDDKAFKSKPVISEVDGYVVERKTTRKQL